MSLKHRSSSRIVSSCGPAVLGVLVLLSACQAPGPKNVADLRRLGDHYLQSGLWAQAAENYGAYLERKPGEPDIRANYGRALMGTGDHTRAVEQLQIAYGQRPDDEATLDVLCDAMLKANQQDSLFRLLKANAADRGRVGDHLRLGKFALATGDADTANLAYTTAARIDRGMTVEPQLGLFDYYLAIGDAANAERRLRMAYFIAPLNIDVQNRIRSFNPIVGPTFALVPAERGTP
ncbi:MAG: tetratricopeptide repeat protein [Phycisphaerales bacterium]